MSINFPAPTQLGQIFTDPTNGNQYVCVNVGPPARWVGAGSDVNLDAKYLRLDATNDPLTGGLETQAVSTTGQVSGNQLAIAGTWDLANGNNWTAGSIAIPEPTNGVTGQSGTLTLTGEPLSWPASGVLKYPEGNAPAPSAFPAVIPYYVLGPSEVLIGTATQNIS